MEQQSSFGRLFCHFGRRCQCRRGFSPLALRIFRRRVPQDPIFVLCDGRLGLGCGGCRRHFWGRNALGWIQFTCSTQFTIGLVRSSPYFRFIIGNQIWIGVQSRRIVKIARHVIRFSLRRSSAYCGRRHCLADLCPLRLCGTGGNTWGNLCGDIKRIVVRGLSCRSARFAQLINIGCFPEPIGIAARKKRIFEVVEIIAFDLWRLRCVVVLIVSHLRPPARYVRLDGHGT